LLTAFSAAGAMRCGLRKFWNGVVRRQDGSVAIQIGLAATIILGMAGLGIEITFLLYKHRQMQTVADAAAFSAAVAKLNGYPTDFGLEARATAASVGYVNGADGVTVTVSSPPLNGNYTANTSAVEVIISQSQTLSLVSLFRSGLFDVGARAVALPGATGTYCVLGLDASASGAVRILNNGVVSSATCGVAVNSSSNTALILDNNASISGPVSVVGNYSLAPGANLYDQTPPYPKTNAAAVSDPYASVTLTASGALQPQPACATSCTLQPGRYTAGLTIPNGATATFTEGVYYIYDHFTLGNTVKVDATAGVTIVINGNYAISIGNNVTMSLTAPTSGNTAGVAFASIRTASSSQTQTFSNNAIINLTGAIYFPNQTLHFDNNSTINTPVCGQLIARIVRLQNNANLRNACGGTGAVPMTGGGSVQLVE
jgi:Flp pilus assembly protein TadG